MIMYLYKRQLKKSPHTRRLAKPTTVGLMLGHRLRHWANIKPTVGQLLMFTMFSVMAILNLNVTLNVVVRIELYVHIYLYMSAYVRGADRAVCAHLPVYMPAYVRGADRAVCAHLPVYMPAYVRGADRV